MDQSYMHSEPLYKPSERYSMDGKHWHCLPIASHPSYEYQAQTKSRMMPFPDWGIARKGIPGKHSTL